MTKTWRGRYLVAAKSKQVEPGVADTKLIEVTWCMVVWCTQNAPRRQQFHVAPAMSAL